jgi:hypothetical protein
LLEGLEAIWEFRLWLHRRAGRIRPFYMPTYETNFTILSEGTLSDEIEVRNDDFTNIASDRTRICVLDTSGTWYFRTITSSEVIESGNDTITLDSTLDIDVDDVVFMGYIGLKRLTSDTAEFTWYANNVAAITLAITEISPI